MKEKLFRCVVCSGWVNEYWAGKICEDCAISYRGRPKESVCDKLKQR